MNQVYFVGAGPGDPSLLTLKGAELLKQCPTVFAFPPYGETFADVLAGKAVLDPFDFFFAELLQRVETELEQGNVAFLVPGDLTFFSPFQAIIEALGARAQVVPGVGTVNAASALLKRTLFLPGVDSRVVLASPRLLGDQKDAPTLEDLAAPGVTLVLYMNDLPLPELVSRLSSRYGENVPIAILHRLGLPGEEVVLGNLDDIVVKAGGRDFFAPGKAGKRSALSLVIVGEGLCGTADPTWWDQRRSRYCAGGSGTCYSHGRQNHARNS